MSVVHEPVLKAAMFANPITDSVNKVYGYEIKLLGPTILLWFTDSFQVK